MSDDLVKRLRDASNGEHDMTPHGADCLQAADRIEELEAALRKSALQELSALGEASEAYQAQLAAEARIEGLEAKLAKAVEALERIAQASDFYSVEATTGDHGADALGYAHKSTCNLALTTLAELKGQDDE